MFAAKPPSEMIALHSEYVVGVKLLDRNRHKSKKL